MTDQEKAEIIATLERQAERARMLTRLYEEAAETVAGFRTEEEYQSLAREAFETEQEFVDADRAGHWGAELAR